MSYIENIRVNPPRSPFERGIESAISQISRVVCNCIEAIEKAYLKHSVYLILQKEYLHKVIMAMVAPVELKVQYDLTKEHYVSGSFYTDQPKSAMASSSAGQQRKVNANLTSSHMMGSPRGKALSASQLQYQKMEEPQVQSVRSRRSSIKQGNTERQPQLYQDYSVGSSIGDDPRKTSRPQESSMAEPHKYRQLTQWIAAESKKGKKIHNRSLMQKVAILNPQADARTAKKWAEVYFKKCPEASEMLLTSGNPPQQHQPIQDSPKTYKKSNPKSGRAMPTAFPSLQQK